MARERYLVGVDPEELKYTPPPPPPSTPKGKWENFWYHYKWVTLGVLAAVVVGIILTVQAATRVKPDYLICMVMNEQVAQSAVDFLETELTSLGEDINGDGEVKVVIQPLIISGENNTQSQTAKQSVIGHIVARDVQLFAFTPSYYTESLAPAMRDGEKFFTTLDVADAGLSQDGTYWNWKGSTALSQDAMVNASYGPLVEQELYFGVREASEKNREECEAHKRLLEAFIRKYPVA